MTDLLEYQGKELLREAGLPVPAGEVARSPKRARAAAKRLGLPVAVKAQVRIGKRGKAGGIRLCATLDEVEAAAAVILAMEIAGHAVEAVLVEAGVSIERELYAAVVLSRHHRCPLLLLAPQGGMDVEEIAAAGGTFLRTPIDPLLGLCDYQVRDAVMAADLGGDGPEAAKRRARGLAGALRGLWCAYHDADALLIEVNPLVVTSDDQVLCLDAKVTLDDNAVDRQAAVRAALAGGDDREGAAREAGLSFVTLDGEVGVIGNGAGLVMSTLDAIAAAGGRAANFCDMGGGARAEAIATALDLVLRAEQVRALVVSVFGGITRCDEVARALVEVFSGTQLEVPVFVRLDGNAASEAHEILAAAGLPGVIVTETAGEAVRLAVAAAAAGSGAAWRQAAAPNEAGESR